MATELQLQEFEEATAQPATRAAVNGLVAVDDVVEVTGLGPARIDVLSNDTGRKLTIVDFTTPNSATGYIVPGKKGFVFNSAAGFNGDTTFTYQIADRDGALDDATVTVTVTDNPAPVGDEPPTATDDRFGVDRGGGPLLLDVLANDLDPEGGDLVVGRFTEPSNDIGTLAFGRKGGLEFTPNSETALGTTGTFNYVVFDETGQRDIGEVEVTLLERGNPGAPVITNPDVASSTGGQSVRIDPLANDSNVFGDKLQLVNVDDPANGFVTVKGDRVTYTPFAGFEGEETFAYEVANGEGSTDTGEITVRVSDNPAPEANAPPTANPDLLTVSTSGKTRLAPLVNDFDPDGDKLSIASVESLPPEFGTLQVKKNGLVFTPAEGLVAGETVEVDYTVIDQFNQGATSSIRLTAVDADATALVANNDVFTVREGETSALAVTANDFGRKLQISDILVEPGKGLVEIAGGTLRYTPNEGASGQDTLEYEVTDKAGNTDTAEVVVEIVAPPPAPGGDMISSLVTTADGEPLPG